MGFRGFVVGGQKLSPEEAVERAKCLSADLPFSPAMVRAMVPRHEEGRLSISTFHSCYRALRLKRDYDYWLDPKEVWPIARGTLLHRALQDPGEGVEVELELARPLAVDGRVYLIEGIVDYWDKERSLLLDYKSTTWVPKEPYESHVWQLRVYAWLLSERVERAVLLYFDSVNQALFPVSLVSDEEVQRYLADHVRAYEQAMSGKKLPPVLGPDQARVMCARCPVRDLCEELVIDEAFESE